MKKIYLKFNLIFLILFSSYTLIYSQDCKPTIISKDGKTEYFGGKIRDLISLFTDDKSAYSFYIVQLNKGKNTTIVFVSFYEPLKDREAYNRAINDYLNSEKLKTSYIEIEVDNMILKIPSTSCVLEPKTTLGDITGYTVNFEGAILKSQVIQLQKSDIKKFKIVLGGKPYERIFNEPSDITKNIKAALNCVNLDNMFEIQKKKPEEMDLTEVSQDGYSSAIIGKWFLQNSNGLLLDFNGEKIIVSQMGKEVSNGTYKISGTRLIYTGTTTSGASNNGVSEFVLFSKDMIILKDKGKEYTYERIK